MIAPRYIHRPPWDSPTALYPATSVIQPRFVLEIGPGRGDFLFDYAQRFPETTVVGVEIKRRRFLQLVKRREAKQAINVVLIYGDARHALSHLAAAQSEPGQSMPIPPRGIDQIYIQFPDPWPKRRHTHNRVVNAEFLALCADSLAFVGELWFITDCYPYAEQVARLVETSRRWCSIYPAGIVTDCATAYPTYFAQKWRDAGRTIYYQRYCRLEIIMGTGPF